MQVAFRVAGTSLDGILTAVDSALDSFFGDTDYTYNMQYIQGEEEFDTSGKPVRFLADVSATTDVSPPTE